MSASVPISPSPLKSAEPHEAQQLPARHAKNDSMSASVPTSPSLLKSAELTVSVAALLVAPPHRFETTQRTWNAPAQFWIMMVVAAALKGAAHAAPPHGSGAGSLPRACHCSLGPDAVRTCHW